MIESVHGCTEIIASMNMLFNGLLPTVPLQPYFHEFAERDEHIPGTFTAPTGVDRLPVLCTLAEIRGDWKFIRELFNMQVGWNSTFLCHHCFARKDDYLEFPPKLDRLPRRDFDSFLSTTRVINEPSDHLHACDVHSCIRIHCTSMRKWPKVKCAQ